MDQLVGITFNGKTVSMPRQNLSAEEIVKLFNTKENGLHLKVRKGLLWENIWPTSSSEINIPENITTALLVAIPNDILPDPEEEMRTRSIKVNAITASSSFSSPRENMSPYQNELKGYGARTVPSFKRQSNSFHGSRKRTKNELPNYKFFMLSDVETEQDPEDIYDVPVDLNK